jgi:RHS repeat-associated protein
LSQTQGVGTAAFSRVSFQYNARGQVTRKTDARGNVTDYAYDSRGFLVSLTEPADRPGAPRPIKRYEFDAAGRLSATVDAAGRRRVLGYDVRNRRISTTYPDATTETATYDRGLVIAEKDRNGTVTEMSYDAATRLVERRSAAGTPAEVVDTRSYLNGTLDMTTEVKRGEQTIHSYDAKGRIVAVTRLATAVAGGALTSQTVYDAVGRKTSDADPYGRRTFYFWDFNSHLRRSVRELVPGAAGSSPATLPRVLEANPGYVIEERATSGTGEVLLAVDGVGAQTRNRYDAVGRLVEETTADGTPAAATCRYVYDAAGNLVQKLHPRTFSEGGTFTTSYTYNGRNLVSSETRGAGTAAASTTRTTYSPTGQRATVADPRGNVTTYTYAAGDDRLIAETDPTGAVKRYQHDAAGNLSATTDANGNVVAMTFDALNRPVTQTNGAGETSTIRYDDNLTDGVGIDAELNLAGLGLGAGADGSAIAETDPAGGTRYTVRDGIGRMVLVQDPNGNATRSSHDAVSGGLVATTTTDALGHVTVVLQDGNGGVRQLIDAEGKATTRTHDAVGRLLSFRDATGAGQTCSLDARGRSTSCTDTQGVVIRFAYDTDDNQVSRTDGAGRTTTCTYDALDRLTGCVDRLGSQRRYAYDTVSNLTSITDAEGAVTSYVYDTRNLLTETRFADGGVARTSYDPAARAATQTDPNGVRIVNSYDRANRLVRRGFPDGLDDAFRYDGASRLIQGTSARYQNVFDRSYDLGGRLVSETLTIGGVARSVRSTYDAADRRTRIDYPDGRAVGLAYTPRNLLLALSVNGVATAAYTHDDAGRIATRTFSNGTTETDTYRADGLLATAALTGASRLAYTYDQNKKVLQERRNGTAFDAFQYDPEERLVRWTRSTNTQVFDLGAEADFRTVTTNGVAQAFAHNAVHAVTQVAGRPLVYDQRGNLLSDDQGRTLAWDPAGRIRRATVGGTTVDYGYDAFGRRITRTSGGITTLFVFDGMQVIDEYENGVVARAYLNGPQIDEPVAMLTPERTLFYARQLNKSVYALLDGSGAVVERYEYTPYGRQTIRSPGGAIRTASAFGNPIGFTGRYLDAATGLVDMRTRDYSPSLGIFTSRDNAYQNGLSLYRAYFAPDGSDPTGHFSLSSVASNIVGGVQKVVSVGAAVAKEVANVAETTAVKVADTILQEAGDFAVGVGHDIYHTGSNGVEWGRRFAVDGLDALVWVETRIPVLAITMGFTPLAIAQLGVAAYNWASSDPIKELEDGSSRLWDFGKASIGLGLWTMTELTPSITFAGRSLFPNDVTTQIGIAFGIGYSIAKGDFTPIPHLDWAAGGLVYVFHVPDFGGLTLGRTIIVDPSLDPEAYPRTAGRGIEVMPHEKAHVYQFQTLGENYLPAHAVEKAIYYSAFVSNPENLPLEKGAYNAPHEQPWPWPL